MRKWIALALAAVVLAGCVTNSGKPTVGKQNFHSSAWKRSNLGDSRLGIDGDRSLILAWKKADSPKRWWEALELADGKILVQFLKGWGFYRASEFTPENIVAFNKGWFGLENAKSTDLVMDERAGARKLYLWRLGFEGRNCYAFAALGKHPDASVAVWDTGEHFNALASGYLCRWVSRMSDAELRKTARALLESLRFDGGEVNRRGAAPAKEAVMEVQAFFKEDGANSVREGKYRRVVMLSGDGFPASVKGVIAYERIRFASKLSGPFYVMAPKGGWFCKGNFALLEKGGGSWRLNCPNRKFKASGTIVPSTSEDDVLTGIGSDGEGREVTFRIGAPV